MPVCEEGRGGRKGGRYTRPSVAGGEPMWFLCGNFTLEAAGEAMEHIIIKITIKEGGKS